MRKSITANELNANISRAASHLAVMFYSASEFYKQVIPEYSDNDELSNGVLAETNTIINEIHSNHEALATNAASMLLEYFKEFDIQVKGIDYYKVSYFYGLALLQHFETESHLIRSLCGIALVYMLDDILRIDIDLNLDDQVHASLLRSMIIKEDDVGYPWKSLFGSFGILYIFKSALKAAQYGEECHE